ncbi:hypothetical protein Taro_017847 [Colocasia esculenta]|uniref:Uncharacterized protein n=1 Tax=Colocasia esculenta TaxID=4460 RepID=A0A843US79_COLES|nr:hypothetical protein [Colocasia esculenta]
MASTFENGDKCTSNGCEGTSNGYKRRQTRVNGQSNGLRKTSGAHLYSLSFHIAPHDRAWDEGELDDVPLLPEFETPPAPKC